MQRRIMLIAILIMLIFAIAFMFSHDRKQKHKVENLSGTNANRTRALQTSDNADETARYSDHLKKPRCKINALHDICRLSDLSELHIPPLREQACSKKAPDNKQPLFQQNDWPLAKELQQLHELCQLHEPATDSHDYKNALIAQKLDSFFAQQLDKPPLLRAFSGTIANKEHRLALLKDTWLSGNAFEHVFCGEIAPSDVVGGHHMWSQYYLAEKEGDIDYSCSVEGLSDEHVATIRYRWRPDGSSTWFEKPVGGFHTYATPACMLAIGYIAHNSGCEPGKKVEPTIQTKMYGQWINWTYWQWKNGDMLTLFPLARD